MYTNNNQIHLQVKRTLKDTLVYLPAKFIPAIIGIFLIRILTNLFSPDEYGYYQITLSTFGFIRVFSMIWLSTSVTRFYPEYINRKKEIFFSTLTLSTLLSAVAFPLVCLLLNEVIFKNKISPDLFGVLNIAIIASVFNTFFEVFVVVFRAGLESAKYTLFWILFAVGKPVVGIVLILFFDFGVEGIFWGFLFIPLILDVLLYYKLSLQKNFKTVHFSKSLLKQFLKYGYPISFSFLLMWVLSYSDRYLIGIFCQADDIGLYSVGYVIPEKTLQFAYMIIMLAAFPVIINQWENHGKEKTQNLVTELTRIYLIFCTPILVTLLIIPDNILTLLSNIKFIEGAYVLPYIAMGIFINGLNQYIQKGFELQKKSMKIALLALIASTVNISLNMIFIPKYGFVGAGMTSLISYMTYFLLALIYVRKDMAWRPPLKTIRNVIIGSLVSGVFLAIVKRYAGSNYITTVGMTALGITLFFVMLVIVKEIRISFIMNVFKSIIFKSKM